MPVGIRLRLARFALWRLKHGKGWLPIIFLAGLVLSSGSLGFAVSAYGVMDVPARELSGLVPSAPAMTEPEFSAALSTDAASHRTAWIEADELGQMQAEVLRLRVLFLRLAELAELDDGEFDLEMNFEPELKSYRHGLPESGLVSFELVKTALVHMSSQAERMQSVFQYRRRLHDFTVSGRPAPAGQVSSRFGYRIDPTSGRRELHQGLDLGGPEGSDIVALADGVVTYASSNGGYGNLVELEHPGGYRTRYAHTESILVPLGEHVSKGQVIARMGSTGRSTGSHLHVEVRQDGRAIDPQFFIR